MVNNKKYWLCISKCCNNRCIFCHDVANQQSNYFIPFERLETEIITAKKNGAKRLIISGGEASIHPDFIKIVKFAKESGFDEIQTITNGRYFYYFSFTKEAIEAGLTEITFSIHGHTEIIHDQITATKGSFSQALQGLSNVRRFPNVIVNIDIVINKLNYKNILDIIKFFSDKFGIYEYDLLQLVPYGRAYDNRQILFYDFNEALPYFRQVFELAKNDKKYFIWTNRLPAQYLEDYEFLIQDPVKILDEISGRKESFTDYLHKNIKLPCSDEFRCAHCFLQDFCKKLQQYKENKNTELLNFTEADKNNWQELKLKTDSELIKIKNFETLHELEKQGLSPHDLNELELSENWKFLNLPVCLAQRSQVKENFLIDYNLVLNENKQIDLQKFTNKYIEDLYYVKSLRCTACKFNNQCSGWHINYIRHYGFKILQPIK